MAFILRISDYDFNMRTELGAGTFGKVYRGKHVKSKMDVAGKKIGLDGSQKTQDFVYNEINNLSRVKHHPYVLHMLYYEFLDYPDDFGKMIHELWLITEFCEAGNLADYHVENNMDFSEKVNISRQCASAIAFLHNMEPAILHRDIKPSNVLIKKEGGINTAKMADFGLAQSSDTKTVFNTVGGTVYYMAPELFDRLPKYRKSIDVFSLGVLLGHLVKALPGQNLEDESGNYIETI